MAQMKCQCHNFPFISFFFSKSQEMNLPTFLIKSHQNTKMVWNSVKYMVYKFPFFIFSKILKNDSTHIFDNKVIEARKNSWNSVKYTVYEVLSYLNTFWAPESKWWEKLLVNVFGKNWLIFPNFFFAKWGRDDWKNLYTFLFQLQYAAPSSQFKDMKLLPVTKIRFLFSFLFFFLFFLVLKF